MDENSLGTGSFAVAIFVIMLFAFGLVIGEHVGEEMGKKCAVILITIFIILPIKYLTSPDTFLIFFPVIKSLECLLPKK